MHRVLSAVAILVATVVCGCSIPTRSIDKDGVLRIVVSPHSYDVGDRHYFIAGFVEIAIGRLDTSTVKRVDIYISKDESDPYPLSPLYRALGKKKIPYNCYRWTPDKPETANDSHGCPLATVAI